MNRRNRMTFSDRLRQRSLNSDLEPGWHNGPSLVVPEPKEAKGIHPEVKRMMETMNANMMRREALLRAEFEKRLATRNPG